jgi:hypothetical protein
MSRTGKEDEVPLKFDEEGNPISTEEGSKSGASNARTLEELMKKLEKLKAENEKLKAKDKKGKSIPPQAKMVTPKRKSPRREGKEESLISLLTTLCPLIIIPCHLLPLILTYSLAKLHILMG